MDRLRYLLGVITLVVMAVAAWFLFGLIERDDADGQLRIEVAFLDARGLKPGADLKYRGIQIGSVQEITVSESGDQALIGMSIREAHRHLIRDNSKFWIVTPRFHGFSSGVTGLETLVRDAYVASLAPLPFGEPRPTGSRFVGAEAPIEARRDVILGPITRGDLLMQVLLPENHGVTVGAKVMFRGMPTGEVRNIDLAPSGTHVVVDVRIASEHRSTVTDASVFWVAQPQLNLQFSMSSPVAMNELGALVVPYLAYFTKPKAGAPLPNEAIVAAELTRPSIDIGEVPKAALTRQPTAKGPEVNGPIVVVRVVYVAEDVDWLTPNDIIQREGTGILFVDSESRVLVLTARSVCDASYFYTETFGERAQIRNERIRVQLADGHALEATRIWVPDEGNQAADLTVLRVEGLPMKYPTSKPTAFAFKSRTAIEQAGAPTGSELRISGEGGAPKTAVPFALDKTVLAEMRGAAVVADDLVFGLVGQVSGADQQPALVTLDILPAAFRPAR